MDIICMLMILLCGRNNIVYVASVQSTFLITVPLIHSITCTACRNGDLRLEGGSVYGSGRVEVCIDNVWGTVCNDSWTQLNAKVVCKQLGFPIYGELINALSLVSFDTYTVYHQYYHKRFTTSLASYQLYT